MLIARYPLRFVNRDQGLIYTNQARLLAELRSAKCALQDGKQKDMAQQCRIYLINLEKSKDRLERFKRNASLNNLSFTRFEGVDLRKEKIECYSDILGKGFDGKTAFPLGSTGCFLSHWKIWKQIIQEDLKYAIICEDDAQFYCNPFMALSMIELPDDVHVVYLNQRVARGLLLESDPNNPRSNYIATTAEAARSIIHNSLRLNAIGNEAYLITKNGAQKLIKMYNNMRFTFNNDWTMYMASLPADLRKEFWSSNKTLPFPETLNFSRIATEESTINSYVFIPALAQMEDNGQPDIGRINKAFGVE